MINGQTFRYTCFRLAMIMFGITAFYLILFSAACALSSLPQWIADAQNVIPVVTSSVGAVLTILGMLNPALIPAAVVTTISAVLGDVTNGLNDVSTLVTQYNAAPAANKTSLLGEIETAIGVVSGGIKKVISDIGVPGSSVSTDISSMLTLALQEIEAWSSTVPALKASAMETVTLTVPFTAKEFEQRFEGILDTPTGNAEYDAIKSKIKVNWKK